MQGRQQAHPSRNASFVFQTLSTFVNTTVHLRVRFKRQSHCTSAAVLSAGEDHLGKAHGRVDATLLTVVETTLTITATSSHSLQHPFTAFNIIDSCFPSPPRLERGLPCRLAHKHTTAQYGGTAVPRGHKWHFTSAQSLTAQYRPPDNRRLPGKGP